ncbi:MAG: TIM barrel protein [Verrucomicrobia bacterium]|nr:TIM barrel protein [Verrucomicrobiota bacterium]
MRIIASTAAWNDDLDLALTRLKALGFGEVDLLAIQSWGLIDVEALASDFESEAARIERLLAKHGLRAVSLNSAFSPDLNDRSDPAGNARRIAQVHGVARLMERLGIAIGAHYPGYIADWKNDPEGVWSDTLASLRDIQAAIAGRSLRLAPEIHFQTPFENPDAARRLFSEFPELPYTYEPSHFIVRGIDVRTTADLLAGASHVHLRGCAKERLQAPPDQSEDDLRWVIESLRARDYQGFVSIEYLPKADFPVEDAISRMHEKIFTWLEA